MRLKGGIMSFLNFLNQAPVDEYENLFETAGGIAGGFAVIFLFAMILLYVFVMGFAVVMYVLQSLGFMSLLKKVGYKRPWFAWVPIVEAKAIGELADKYDDGKPSKNLGKKLFGMNIAIFASTFVFFIMAIVLAIMSAISPDTEALFMGIAAIAFLVFWVAMMIVSIVYTVYYYIAIWRIFRIFAPKAATIFILVSIFVSGSLPLIVFLMRDQEPKNLVSENNTDTTGNNDQRYTYDPNGGFGDEQ